MKIFHGTENANISKPTVLTLGVFDGLHLGHQRIMQTVVDRAKLAGAVPTAITFDPHPRAVLHPASAPPLLQTLDQRLANFEVLGIKQAIVIPFTIDIAASEAEAFLENIVRDRLHAKEVYLGQGFAFGKDRGGNIEMLREVSGRLGFVGDDVDEVLSPPLLLFGANDGTVDLFHARILKAIRGSTNPGSVGHICRTMLESGDWTGRCFS